MIYVYVCKSLYLIRVLLEHQLQTLYKFIEQKGDLQDLLPLINSLTKQKSSAVAQMAKQGQRELEEVVSLLQKLAVKLQVSSSI